MAHKVTTHKLHTPLPHAPTAIAHTSAPCPHLFTPSMWTVVGWMIHTPMPAVMLTQPAMEPPIPVSSWLVLHFLKHCELSLSTVTVCTISITPLPCATL